MVNTHYSTSTNTSGEYLCYSPPYKGKAIDSLNSIIGNDTSTTHTEKSKMTKMIKDVEILQENKVVRVTFKNGDSYKAVCNEADTFSLERAIEICICKYLMGGTAQFNNTLRSGLKLYEDKIREEEEKKEAEIAEKERIAKRRAKHDAYIARCRKKEEEKQIEMQKEAYLRAMREYKEERRKRKFN